MTDENKIQLADLIIRFISDNSISTDNIPVMVGVLNKRTGINGFKVAEIGHPVFEFKDKYIIYLDRADGLLTAEIPYRKETLKNSIDFG